MASEVKANKISPATSTTVTLGDASDLFQLPASAEIDIASGATLDVNGTIDITGATTTGFPSSGFNSVQVFTSTGTWTKPAGITKVIVEVISAGGGSGSNSAAATSGGPGGGGAYASKVLDVTDIDTATATVGAAGAAASYISAQAGATGGVSSFAKLAGSGSFTTVTCPGGTGGANNTYAPGGFSGAPTTGDINVAGCNGIASTSSYAVGGDTQYGWGGRGTGSSGVGYGVGGTCSSGTYKDGIVGRDGIVIVWEYK